MKKIIVVVAVIFSCFMHAQKTSAKVVVTIKGEEVGRLIGENATQYHISVQDEVWIPKKGHKVLVYSAKKGQGIIYLKDFGIVNLRQNPNIQSPIVGKLIYEEGELPETYDCMGYENGWYKTKVNGKVGYVKEDFISWDSLDSF